MVYRAYLRKPTFKTFNMEGYSPRGAPIVKIDRFRVYRMILKVKLKNILHIHMWLVALYMHKLSLPIYTACAVSVLGGFQSNRKMDH